MLYETYLGYVIIKIIVQYIKMTEVVPTLLKKIVDLVYLLDTIDKT